jgi:hypothetical protein
VSDALSGVKSKIYDRVTMLMHYFLFRGVAFEKVELLVLSWWF